MNASRAEGERRKLRSEFEDDRLCILFWGLLLSLVHTCVMNMYMLHFVQSPTRDRQHAPLHTNITIRITSSLTVLSVRIADCNN